MWPCEQGIENVPQENIPQENAASRDIIMDEPFYEHEDLAEKLPNLPHIKTGVSHHFDTPSASSSSARSPAAAPSQGETLQEREQSNGGHRSIMPEPISNNQPHHMNNTLHYHESLQEGPMHQVVLTYFILQSHLSITTHTRLVWKARSYILSSMLRLTWRQDHVHAHRSEPPSLLAGASLILATLLILPQPKNDSAD